MMLSPLMRQASRLAPTARNIVPRAAFHTSTPALNKEETALENKSILSDYRVQVPIGFLCAIPLLQNQVVVLSEETQLLGCFMVFVGTIYSQAGDAIGKFLDAKGESVIAVHNAKEQEAIDAMKRVIEAHKSRLTLVDELKSMYSYQSSLIDQLAAAKSIELQHKCRDETVRQLDFYINAQESARTSGRQQLIQKASTFVEEQLRSNDSVQKWSLDEALSILEHSGKKSKTKGSGSDLVGQLFSHYFDGVTEGMKAKAGTEVELPESLVEEGHAQILALRKSFGVTDEDLSHLPKKATI